ncbi:hypothetical protein [Mucilaginibacter arboris]|uniref:Uncharacterized protein n=1 Tax=Mucilaginibacter arboris TaxID=2682090 RepID=A0A7K1SWY4_9SPHI|nr:hypothetical protein [Mucilaginibacter arboris]MVN21570.1 hypothetical protein [Mucilaginibacter arboris]
MEKANSHQKPSPSDDKTFPGVDEGHKSKLRKEDKTYHEDDAKAKTDNPAEYYQNEEQPVQPIKDAPKEP